MIAAYLDESGSHADSKIFALAGYYGDTQEWGIFSRQWKVALDRAGLNDNPFHMADFESCHGIFEGWSSSRKVALIEDLVGVIDRRELRGVGAAIVMEDYKEVVAGASEFLENKWAPYVVCQQLCYQIILKHTNADIIFIHDRQDEYDYPARSWFLDYKDGHPEVADRMKGITFSSKSDFRPLQAADILAYETAKGLHNVLYDPNRPHRRSMLALARRRRLDGRFFDRNGSEYLVNLAEYGHG